MDDFMDSLVKEVEGNLKPIRAERLDDSTTFPVMDSVPVTVIRENEPAPLSQSIAMYREQPRYYQAPPMYREPSGVPMDQEVMGMPRFRGDAMGTPGYREPVMGTPQYREPAVSMPVYQEPSGPVRSQEAPAAAEGSGTQGTPGAAGTEPPKDGNTEEGKDLSETTLTQVAEHKDLKDKGQTVLVKDGPVVSPPPKTGDNTMLWLYGVLFAGAFGSMIALVGKEYIKKRRQAKKDAEMFI